MKVGSTLLHITNDNQFTKKKKIILWKLNFIKWKYWMILHAIQLNLNSISSIQLDSNLIEKKWYAN